MKIFENRPKLAALAATILVTGAFGALLGSFSGQAVAAPGGNSSTHLFAVGGFTLTGLDAGGITHMAFAAQQNPIHTTVFAGHVVQETATGFRSGPVICMSESSNTQATVEWTVANSNISGDVVGETRSFEVQDNGNPVMGVSPDMFKDRGTDANCNTDNNGTFEPLVHGNIVVSP
jgi:hypothetical protein